MKKSLLFLLMPLAVANLFGAASGIPDGPVLKGGPSWIPAGTQVGGEVGKTWSVRNDVLIVALTILGEAAGEKEAGMYAVACVIEQRAKKRNLTPMAACLQEKQFSCWNNKKVGIRQLSAKHLYAKNAQLTKEGTYALRLARSVHYDWRYRKDTKKQILKLEYTGYADHYHNLEVNPSWANKDKFTKQIGNHRFYKLRK